MQVNLIISMVFAVIIALFAVANSEPVSINLIFRTYELSQAVVILVSAVVGALMVFVLNLVSKAKQAMKAKNLKKEIKDLNTQLETCQNQLQVHVDEKANELEKSQAINLANDVKTKKESE